jgi:2-amino-4-hydroxy-6-hydroxymethyldihydropteridine diphosphokinase
VSEGWTHAWIALGSNLGNHQGDRRSHLDRSVVEIGALPGVRVGRVSRWIETEPVGGPPDQPRFLNGALELDTRGSARELLARLQAIERAHGRDRAHEPRHGPRTLDLDLLLFGDESIDEPGLTVPHPGLEERVFVLAPLSEIAPELTLPRSGRSVAARLAELQSGRSPARHSSAS